MIRYHINPSTGNPGACSAKKGNCPFGGDLEHYSTAEDARHAYEKVASVGAQWSSMSKPKVSPEALALMETEYEQKLSLYEQQIQDADDFATPEYMAQLAAHREALNKAGEALGHVPVDGDTPTEAYELQVKVLADALDEQESINNGLYAMLRYAKDNDAIDAYLNDLEEDYLASLRTLSHLHRLVTKNETEEAQNYTLFLEEEARNVFRGRWERELKAHEATKPRWGSALRQWEKRRALLQAQLVDHS